MIERLRAKYPEKKLQLIYAHQYDHTKWEDHITRIKETIRIGNIVPSFIDGLKTVADLSAGDGAIINGINIDEKILGDYIDSYKYVGPIEKTIKQIPVVDMFIFSETLEHVDNPLEVLKAIRQKTKWLLLSTPENNWEDPNPEHYWAWDKDGVQDLLEQAGFEPVYFESIPIVYTHQIWICK
jgi:hypothetical protein